MPRIVTERTDAVRTVARAPDPVAVPDAHLVIGQAFKGEVLGKLSEAEVIPAKFPLPVAVAVDRMETENRHHQVRTGQSGEVGAAAPTLLPESALASRGRRACGTR